MHTFETLLVALPLTSDDPGLLATAAALADRLDIGMRVLVHVMPDGAVGDAAACIAALDRVRAAASSFPGGAQAELRFGEVVPTLLDAAEELEADALVLGRGEGPKSPTLGGKTGRVVRQSPCSVCVVPEGDPPALRPIFVPVDFSPRSGEALQVALALAPKDQVVAAHAVGLPLGWERSGRTVDQVIDALAADATSGWRASQAALGGAADGVRLKLVIDEDPSLRDHGHIHDLIEAAHQEQAGLVVLGSRGRSVGAALLLGSVAAKLVDGLQCAVFVVKQPGETVGVLEALGAV